MSDTTNFYQLINGETPVLVDFSAEWCGPCKMMAPILKEVAQHFGDSVKVIKVDVDKNPLTASYYNIQGVPTLILFKSGMILWRQSGVVPAPYLIQTIQSLVGNKAETNS
jgi:thioredoxin 1